jgi:hypothetical protein
MRFRVVPRLFAPLLALLVVPWTSCRAPASDDLLADDIARWSAAARDTAGKGETWAQVAPAASLALTAADAALRQGRRLYALQRDGRARTLLIAALYARDHIGAASTIESLELEWKRIGEVLSHEKFPPLSQPPQPAAVRALAEAADHQARVNHAASLEYGRNTEPAYGLYYLGLTEAGRDHVALLRRLSRPAAGRAPTLRSIAPEIDALESELLAAYRPPASIDRHPDFIRASADVKEARELDAAGLRHGALMRYLEGVQKVTLLRTANPADSNATRAELDRIEAALDREKVDHTIGRMFIEAARFDPAAPAAGVIASHVLPRYRAALAPAAPLAARPAPAVTVTLVRWPFT